MLTFLYQNDDIRETQLNNVIPQTRLLVSTKTQFKTELKQLVDICDLLALLETTKDFLLVTETTVEDNLLEKMQQFHLKPTQCTKILRQIKLSELDDLIDLLHLMRAQQMINFKQDPFGALREEYRETLEDEVGAQAVTRLMRILPPEEAISKLLQFIRIRLAKHTDQANGQLGAFMYGFLEEKDDPAAEEVYEALGEEVLNSHAASLFALLVKNIQGRA